MISNPVTNPRPSATHIAPTFRIRGTATTTIDFLRKTKYKKFLFKKKLPMKTFKFHKCKFWMDGVNIHDASMFHNEFANAAKKYFNIRLFHLRLWQFAINLLGSKTFQRRPYKRQPCTIVESFARNIFGEQAKVKKAKNWRKSIIFVNFFFLLQANINISTLIHEYG